MNHRIKTGFRGLLLGAALAVATIATPQAQAQGDVRGANLFQGQSAPAMVLSGSQTNQTPAVMASTRVALRPGYGLSLAAIFAPTNSSTSTTLFKVALSYDGTNWMTTNPLEGAFPLKATASCAYGTNFPASSLEGARFAALWGVSNAHTAAIFLTNVGLSVVK
jgi:FtsH-binding integral membrane protein